MCVRVDVGTWLSRSVVEMEDDEEQILCHEGDHGWRLESRTVVITQLVSTHIGLGHVHAHATYS